MKRTTKIVSLMAIIGVACLVAPVYPGGQFTGENGSGILIGESWDLDAALSGRTPGDGRTIELQLQPGILDQGSMQVAAMLDMLSSAGPGGYAIADGDSVKLYEYSPNGTQVLSTALGSIETQAFTRQRQGSSRGLLLWVAPRLSFLPVRMEQQKNGRTEMVFILKSVEGL